jgi:hypothetical protein
MDAGAIRELATAVAALTGPYLASSAEQFSGAAGKAAWQAVGRLVSAVRSKFATSGDSTSSVEALGQDEQPDCKAAARAELERLLASDQAFAGEVATLLAQADRSGADRCFNTQIHGSVQKLTQIGVVHGDIYL